MADIKMAAGDRLDTKFLLSGQVKIAGVDIAFHNPGRAPFPTFRDNVTTLPYDVGELTIVNYIVARDHGVPIIGLPVIPDLFFPLTGVTVNKNAGINSPRDLAGKRVGTEPGYASNPAVWLRGILVHHYDVSAESITWVEGESDSLADIPYTRSARYKIEKGANLAGMLSGGELDALIGAGGAARPAGNVVRLVTNPFPILKQYFDSTGVFPINTMLIMKQDSVTKYPGLADAVIAASEEARALYNAEEPDDGMAQGLRVGELRKLGLFPRQHGLDVHGDTVRMAVQYLYEQGLIRRLWTLEELFV